MAIYERASERRVAAVLTGTGASGVDELRLVRFDSAAALESRSALESRWSHFASYDALGDSIAEDGGRLERGPVRLDLGPAGWWPTSRTSPRDPRGDIALSWVSVAAPGDRLLGAGRSLREAWSNLLGRLGPLDRGAAPRPPGWRRRVAGSSAPIPRSAQGTGPASARRGTAFATRSDPRDTAER